jgi:hypothetical protein
MNRHLLVSALIGLICLTLLGCGKQARIEPPPPNVQALEVRLRMRDPNGEQQLASTRSTDTAAIQHLLTLIQNAKPVEFHKCSAGGEIILYLPDDYEYRYVEILPGHDPNSYEVRRAGQPYRLPRAEFMSALKALGVTDIPE